MNIFTIINVFNCDVSSVVNINPFVNAFCLFLTSLSRNFGIDHVVVKTVRSIFNFTLFDFSHLQVQWNYIY